MLFVYHNIGSIDSKMKRERFVDIYRDNEAMNKAIDIKKIKFYLWVGLGYFLIGLMTTAGKYPDKFLFALLNSIWGIIYVIVVNYILFEYTVPFVLKKRNSAFSNILLAILFLWIYMMLYSYGGYLWRQIGMQLHIYTALKEFSSLSKALENQMGYSVGSVVVFGLSRHVYNYIKLSQAEQQWRFEKQTAELNYLRSQTNPHFLFNTLNNIYSLARDKSDLAAESILRLSKILRFMLYETSGEYIAIEQELQIMRDYIDLEKLRYDKSLRVNFNNDIEDMKQAIPPLLLMPLVENAFKHGVSETRSQPFVDIHLSVNKRILTFIVKNSTDGSDPQEIVKENIGLSNLRRQLELLYTDYSLSIQPGASAFTATLKINLASHV
jgi:two-component system LytT family sensor kinase